MSRLPTPGQDSGQWGDILNEFLSQAHTNTGTLKDGSVTTANIANGGLAPSSVTGTALVANQLGAANGVAQLDGSSKLSPAQIPTSVATKSTNSGDAGKAIDAYTGSPLVVNGPALVPAWQPTTAYVASQAVTAAGKTWIARDAHTSAASFASDQAAHWDVLVGSSTCLVTLALKGSPLVVGIGAESWVAPVAGTFLGVAADSGGLMTIDINKNGTTIFTTQANRPMMTAANGFIAPERVPDITTFVAGDKFTVDIDALASSGGDWIGNSAVSSSTGSTNGTIALPTPAQAPMAVGDILLASITIYSPSPSGVSISSPPGGGWTVLGSGVTATGAYLSQVFWRRADASDAATSSFDFPFLGVMTSYAATMVTYRNLFATGDVMNTWTTVSATSTNSLTVPALTPTVSDTIRVVFVALSNGQTVSATPAGMTARASNIFDRKVTGQPANSGSDTVALSATNNAGAIYVLLKPGSLAGNASYAHVSLRYRES